MQSAEEMRIRRDFDRAVAMTFASIGTLRKLREEYGVFDHPDDESSIQLLRKALEKLVEDRDYLLEFVSSMEDAK